MVTNDDEGSPGWDDAGPLLVAVPGGAAAGIDPIITFIDMYASGDTEDLNEPEAYFDGNELYVDLGETVDGMTQARFVEIWSSLPVAAATFTAVANAGPVYGPPDSDDAEVDVECSRPTADYTVVVTFNQPVGAVGAFGTTPTIAEFGALLELGGPPPPDAASPLYGVADADGNSVFTFSWDDLCCGVPVQVGTENTLPAFSVENAVGVVNDDITVTITAG